MSCGNLLTSVVVGLAVLAAGCASEAIDDNQGAEVAPEPVAEQPKSEEPDPEPDLAAAEAETAEPDTDPSAAEPETAEPDTDPSAAEPDAAAASSSTTSSAPEATSTTTSSPAVECDFSHHAEDVLGSVYQVLTDDGIGTAFYLGDGEWLTAAHVVGTHSRVALHNGLSDVSVAVKGIDYNADLALLEGAPTAGQTVQALRIEEDEAPQPGDTAIVVGYPLYEEDSASVSRGIVSRYEDDSLLGQLVVSDASANPGNSGGPMLNECGNVIGVVVQKYVGLDVEGITYAVSTESITAQLPRLRRGFKGTPPTTGDALEDPAGSLPEPQGWVILETEPDLLTGETRLYMVVEASEVEREYDFYEMPNLAMGCEGGWSVWWGGDTIIAYDDEMEVAYRVGRSETEADTWIADDEWSWLSTSAADAILAAGPDDELVIRAYEYDGDIFATAVFPLQRLSDAVIEFTAQCSNPTWEHIIADWGRAVLTEGLDGQLRWLRLECPAEPHQGFIAVLLLGTAEPHDEDADGWMRYRFGNEDGPWASLGRVYRWEDGDAFSAYDTSRELESALDADTTGVLHIDIDRVRSTDPVASDTFDVTGWHEAKEWLQASC